MPPGLPRAPLPIDGFLCWLRSQGFVIGVDSHLLAQELLERAGPECVPGDLKTLLCPLFARSEEQQDAFYRAFDRWFDLFDAPHGAITTRATEPPGHLPPPRFQTPRKVNRWIYAAAALLALAAAITWWLGKTPPKAPPVSAGLPAPVVEKKAAPASEPPVSSTAQPKASKTARPSPAAPDAQPQPGSPSAAEPFLERNQTMARWLMAVLPALLLVLLEVRRRMRRSHVLQKQKGRKAPYSWPVRIESGPRVYHSPQFYTAARRLQRRQRGEAVSLDVEASIEATVGSLGFPALKYTPDSRVPEYLVLIDRTSFRDHQAHLFEALGRALHEEGLFVTTLFFDGDPRVCRSERQDAEVYLADLERRHSGDRLILFGDGDRLIDPVTGRLAGWTALLQSWTDRAVLTPAAPSAWGLNERTLASQFVVLPASLDGLLALVNHFERSSKPDIRTWREASGEPRTPDSDAVHLVPSLREYLGAPAFEWLCACAVYPELHWDLTLHLGSLPGWADNPITEANLLRLIRLPWFRAGSIPEELRWALIQELGPARQNAVREAILQLLEENPPPKDSVASDLRSFQIVFQRYCLNRRDRRRRRELLEALKTLPPSELHRDYTILKALESMRVTALDFVLPSRMRRMLYQGGVPAFGLKSGIQFLVLAPLCLFLCLFTISFVKNIALETRVRSAEAAVAALQAPAPELASLDSLRKLDSLRMVVQTLRNYQRNGVPWEYRWGLYAGDRLYPKARRAYFDGFQKLLLAQTQDAIVPELGSLSPSHISAFQPQYDALRTYLITTVHHERSGPSLTPVLLLWWANGQHVEQDRLQLARMQFDYYAGELKAANPFSPQIDTAAVAKARAYLNVPFAGVERIYAYMLAEADKASAPINFNSLFPDSLAFVVDRHEVRGAFTKAGWTFIADAIAHVDRYAGGEAWVLGDQEAATVNAAAVANEVTSRYSAGFLGEWSRYLVGASVVPYSSLKDAADKLNQFSGAHSWLLKLLEVAAQNTAVDDPTLSRLFQPLQSFMRPGKSIQDYRDSLAHLKASIDAIANRPATDATVAQAIAAESNVESAVIQLVQGLVRGSPVREGERVVVEPLLQIPLLTPIRPTRTLLANARPPIQLTQAATGADSLKISFLPLPAAWVGEAYSANLQASNEKPPYQWSIASGSLPPGLQLDAGTGLIRGVPSAVGSFTLSVRATDTEFHSASTTQVLEIRPEGKTLALLVGISKYKDERINQLEYAHEDVIGMAQLLESPRAGAVPAENIVLLTNEMATRTAIQAAIEHHLELKAGKNDTVILFIVAHGTLLPDKKGYIVAYDTSAEDVATTGIPIDDIATLFETALKARRLLLFVDVAHAGKIGQIVPSFDARNTADQTLAKGRGPLEISGILAARAGQTGKEGPQWGGGHGAFTYFLMSGMNGKADFNSDKRVDMQELFDYVRDNVRASTAGSQVPKEIGDIEQTQIVAYTDRPGIELAPFTGETKKK